MSRFHGPQRKGAMTEYRALKREEALDRWRASRLLEEERRKSTKHVWVPSPVDFKLHCHNEKCEAVWLPDHAQAPKTNCPHKKEAVRPKSENKDRRSKRTS
jgi:hypothetical protein